MNRVVKIIMERDNLTQEEAQETVDLCKEEIHNAIEDGRWYEVEDIVADYLGLEPDYIMDLL